MFIAGNSILRFGYLSEIKFLAEFTCFTVVELDYCRFNPNLPDLVKMSQEMDQNVIVFTPK